MGRRSDYLRYGGFTTQKETSHLGEQALLAGLADDEIAALAKLSTPRRYDTGQRIIGAGEPANSAVLSAERDGERQTAERRAAGFARTRHGVRRDGDHRARRSADVWADTSVSCLELPVDAFADYSQLRPEIAMKIMRNLSGLLARQLILAYAKVDLLSAFSQVRAWISRRPRKCNCGQKSINRARDRARRPVGDPDALWQSPVCQKTSIGMPPRGYQ